MKIILRDENHVGKGRKQKVKVNNTDVGNHHIGGTTTLEEHYQQLQMAESVGHVADGTARSTCIVRKFASVLW